MQRITPSSIVVHHKVAWAKPRTEFFIKLVRKHPCLYQPNALNYLDRDKRTKALQDIHRSIQKMIPEVTINDLKNKLKNLRTQYIKELRLVERSQGKGGSEEEYKPKLWCYQMLSFFQPNPSINKRPVSSSSEHEDDDNEAVEENDNDDEEGTGTDSSVHNAKNNNKAQNHSDPSKCDKQTVKSHLNEYIQRIQSLRRAIDKRKRREFKYDWLGKMVASQMEQLDERTQIKVAWDIQCMLRKHLDKVQERTKPNDKDELKPEVYSDEDNPAFEFIVDNGDTLQQEELDEMELEYEIEEDDDDEDEVDDTE